MVFVYMLKLVHLLWFVRLYEMLKQKQYPDSHVQSIDVERLIDHKILIHPTCFIPSWQISLWFPMIWQVTTQGEYALHPLQRELRIKKAGVQAWVYEGRYPPNPYMNPPHP